MVPSPLSMLEDNTRAKMSAFDFQFELDAEGGSGLVISTKVAPLKNCRLCPEIKLSVSTSLGSESGNFADLLRIALRSLKRAKAP